MDTKIFYAESFTLGKFIEETEDCNDNALVLNSCMFSKYTLDNIDKDSFEQIRDIYDENSSTMVDFVFSGDIDKSLTVGDFRKFAKNNKHLLNKPIERDIEDGFVHSNYNNIVYNENRIILC